MALYRAFIVGRFKCAGVSPKISTADFRIEGYVLAIRKDTTKKFCLRCITDIIENRGGRVTEDMNYLTIHSP